MKKFLLSLILCFMVVNLYSQEVVEIVPTTETEEDLLMLRAMQARNKFNEIYSIKHEETDYDRYCSSHSFEEILKDACEWKKCKKPFFEKKQIELVDEFKKYLFYFYDNWIEEKESGKSESKN